MDHKDFPADVLKLIDNGLKDGKDNLYLGIVLHELFAVDGSRAIIPDLQDTDSPLLSENEQFISVLSGAFQNDLHKQGFRAERCYGECLDPLGMVNESAYADLLVMSSRYLEEFLTHPDKRIEFIQTLKNIQCPLLFIPPGFQDFSEIILLRKSTREMVNTIKSIEAVLSKNLRNAEVSLLCEMPEHEEEFENEKRLMSFLRQHFRNVGLMMVYDHNMTKEAIRQIQSASFPLLVIDHFSECAFQEFILPTLRSPGGEHVSFFIGSPNRMPF